MRSLRLSLRRAGVGKVIGIRISISDSISTSYSERTQTKHLNYEPKSVYIRIYNLTLNSFSSYPIVCYICIYERSAPQYNLTSSISIAIRSLTV